MPLFFGSLSVLWMLCRSLPNCSLNQSPIGCLFMVSTSLLLSVGRRFCCACVPIRGKQPHKHHISTVQVQALVAVIGEGAYSVKEIMGLLQLKNRSYFSKEYLKPAIETGLLESIYPEQPKHPKQKYRLTDKGKDLLKRQ